tara:strand:+ start:3390 stop:5420 length:2031 start_codon:yes stop_codon:yes gene_type:complete
MVSRANQNSYAKMLSTASTLVSSYDGTDATFTIKVLTDKDISSMINGNFIALQAVPSDVTLNFQNTGAYSETNELVTLSNPDAATNPYESVHMTGIYFDKPATVNTTSITTGETGISAGAWTRGSQSASPPVSNLNFTTDDLNATPVVFGTTDQLPGYRLQGDRGVNVVANRCFVTNPYVAEGTPGAGTLIAEQSGNSITFANPILAPPAAGTNRGTAFANCSTNIIDFVAPLGGVLTLSVVNGGSRFVLGEPYGTTTDPAGGAGLVLTPTELAGFSDIIVTVRAVFVGSGYSVGDTITITNPNPAGLDAQFTVTGVSSGESYQGDLSGVYMTPRSGTQPYIPGDGVAVFDNYAPSGVAPFRHGGASNGCLRADLRQKGGHPWDPEIAIGGYQIFFGNRYRPFTIIQQIEGVTDITYTKEANDNIYFTFNGPAPPHAARVVGLPSLVPLVTNFTIGNRDGEAPGQTIEILNNTPEERNMGTIGVGTLTYGLNADEQWRFQIQKSSAFMENVRGPLLINFSHLDRSRKIIELGDNPIQIHDLSVGENTAANADRLHKVIWGTRAEVSPDEDKSAILRIIPTLGSTASPLRMITTRPRNPVTGIPITNYRENSYVNFLSSVNEIFERTADGTVVQGYGDTLLLGAAGGSTKMPSINVQVQWVGHWQRIFFTPIDVELV